MSTENPVWLDGSRFTGGTPIDLWKNGPTQFRAHIKQHVKFWLNTQRLWRRAAVRVTHTPTHRSPKQGTEPESCSATSDILTKLCLIYHTRLWKMGNEQSVSEEPTQVKRRRAETVWEAEPKSLSFWFGRQRRFTKRMKTARWTACRRLAVSFPHLSPFFWGLRGALIRPALLCKPDSQLVPLLQSQQEACLGWELFDLSWCGLCRMQPCRTPTGTRVCLRAHMDPGNNEDVPFSHGSAHVYFTQALDGGFVSQLQPCAASESRPSCRPFHFM